MNPSAPTNPGARFTLSTPRRSRQIRSPQPFRYGTGNSPLLPRVTLAAGGGSNVTLRNRVVLILSLIAIQSLALESALAQTRSGTVTIRYAAFSPVIALLAGILILIIPRLLNYIVAVYL